MNDKNSFSITSSIEFTFKESEMRNIAYTSFLPEYNKLKSTRSQTIMKKKNGDVLLFNIESKDITAFRASMNDVISFGKIIESVEKIINK
ncbi:MAG: hypothetical protein GF317_06305 [Candidatus Lokiarchaeota archaeon]|nr:hypothetical protein [Candidatus Lokiarchaeota archaeon]MBD3199334.1 hypothetical protein [Candidatus Lokiarchaeota archaeon]